MGFIRLEDVQSYTDVSTCGEVLNRTDPAGLTRSIYVDPDDSPTEALKKIEDSRLPFLPLVDIKGIYTGTVDTKRLWEILERESKL